MLPLTGRTLLMADPAIIHLPWALVEQVYQPVRGFGCQPIWYGIRTRHCQIHGLVLYL